MLEDNATFLCGHPKSGTSLLRGMLDSHPQLVVFPEETKFFRRILPDLVGLEPGERTALVEDRILHIFQWRADAPSATQAGFLDRDYADVDAESVSRAFRRRTAGWTGHEGRLLSAAILAYGEACGFIGSETRRWVEKTPYNERYALRIYEWWPEARCLHVVRDPRDNFASYRRKHPDWSPETFADSWRRSTLEGWSNEARIGWDQYRVMRYEDLVLQTDAAIADIIPFLGIEDADTLRSPTRDGRRWEGNSMFNEAFHGISRRPVGRYAEALSPEESRELVKRLGPEMERLGYPRTEHLRLSERLAGRALRAWWTLRRFRAGRQSGGGRGQGRPRRN
jgi:hypothetical protein